MKIELLAGDDPALPWTPWLNGAGLTQELALWPRGASLAAGLDFRISRARVEQPGPFSSLPDVERILVVARGDALELTHSDAAPRARLRPLEPYRFAGDWPTAGALPAGPVEAFNVMLGRGRARAEVETWRLGARRVRTALDRGHAFLYVPSGRLRARLTAEEQPFSLEAEDSLWVCELAGGEELELCGEAQDTCALLVRIEVDA